MKRTLISLILLSLTNTASAEMYTWKDEQGVTHATDRLSDAPPEIQEKYRKPNVSNTSKSKFAGMFEEGYNHKGKYYITTFLEQASKEPEKYKYMWTAGEITFYASRTMDDSELSILPQNLQPHGKFIKIFFQPKTKPYQRQYDYPLTQGTIQGIKDLDQIINKQVIQKKNPYARNLDKEINKLAENTARALMPFIIIGIAWFLLWGLTLYDILTNEFKGNNKVVWTIVITFLGPIGVFSYITIGRKQKIKETQTYESNHFYEPHASGPSNEKTKFCTAFRCNGTMTVKTDRSGQNLWVCNDCGNTEGFAEART